ncbi:DnaJ domain-containing protein [Natrinema zhouii]|uniref:DnaJ domain-containing protein n=1 Tax=Natrinema zhouii TaxID=1710539 RepID=A0A7D6CS15_9EURY|nr:DnaJ domain-containing protein [Natrinema zhouii]QLK26453.1 DnaJ domain-containing protein [Natrinema zhouii]
MTDDFYDLLEIPSDAAQDEIKDAYREQVRVYHPDLNDDDRARAQFTAVKTAYDILGDPVERQAYDRLGHKDYVAKRTSGLPSPDVWKSDGDDEEADGTELSYSESAASETASASASTSSATSGSRTAGSATAGAGGTTSTASGAAAGTASGASRTNETSAGTGTGAGTASGSASGTAGQTGGAGGGTTTGTGGSAGTGTGTASGSRSTTTANPLVRWWRRQNFSLPLIWLSVIVYAAGIIDFALANGESLGSLWADGRAIGANPSGIWALLTESHHGIETMTAFVQRVEFVTPPLEPTLWYAALAGVVALALAALLVTRAVRREDTWGAVTINETIVVAVAVATTTTLVGGPLLAGAVLMPLLFAVIIRHTKRLPGWAPSYLYVVPVLAPAAGFGAAAAGVVSLPVDLAAFVLCPLVGGLALPVRTTIRKHFGR